MLVLNTSLILSILYHEIHWLIRALSYVVTHKESLQRYVAIPHCGSKHLVYYKSDKKVTNFQRRKKIRENTQVVYSSAGINFDLTRKMTKKYFAENSWKYFMKGSGFLDMSNNHNLRTTHSDTWRIILDKDSFDTTVFTIFSETHPF